MLKETTALRKAGFQVLVFALWDLKMPRLEIIEGVKVHRIHIKSRVLPRRKMFLPMKFTECALRMFLLGVRERPDIVHAHDLDGLTVAYLIAKWTKCSLIYDSHELWSGFGHLARYPNWVVKIALVAERLMVRQADQVITVSDGIAREMEKNLNIPRPTVLRNVPEKSLNGNDGDLHKILKIPESAVIFLYIGNIIQNRGLRMLIKAFVLLNDPRAYLVFLGAPELPSWLNIPIPGGIRERILVHPPVNPRQVVPLARSADIGVHPIRGICKSHRFCLPNKLFEYIQAGLAVIATDLPAMTAIIGTYRVGCVFRDGEINDLRAKMQFLLQNQNKVDQLRKASHEASEDLNWEKEKIKLTELYDKL